MGGRMDGCYLGCWASLGRKLDHIFTVDYTPIYYLLPSTFWDYLTPTSAIHTHDIRHNKLYLIHVNTRFGQRLLSYKGS